MQFQKWAQAEVAMEAHNGKTRLGNSEVPLVVKFADAKRKDAVAGQVCMTSSALYARTHFSCTPVMVVSFSLTHSMSPGRTA